MKGGLSHVFKRNKFLSCFCCFVFGLVSEGFLVLVLFCLFIFILPFLFLFLSIYVLLRPSALCEGWRLPSILFQHLSTALLALQDHVFSLPNHPKCLTELSKLHGKYSAEQTQTATSCRAVVWVKRRMYGSDKFCFVICFNTFWLCQPSHFFVPSGSKTASSSAIIPPPTEAGRKLQPCPPCRFDSRQNWLCLLSRTDTGSWARQAWSYLQVRSDREYWPNRTSTSKFACSDACRSILAPCWSQQKKWADKQVMKSLVRCTNKFLREFVRNSEVRQGNFARQVDFEAILC